MAYINNQKFASRDEAGLVKAGQHLHITDDGVVSVNVGSFIEEGLWQPKLISGPGGGAITVKVLHAIYIKLGSRVHADFDLQVTDMEAGKASSQVMLEGIPFMSVSSSGFPGSLVVSYFKGMDSPTIQLSGSVRPSSYCCDIWYASKNVTALEKLEYGDVQISTRLQGFISYSCL